MLLYVDAQYASPYAMSVFVALHEKVLPFDIATVDLSAAQNKSRAYTSMSITQRVPTLVHDDFALSESSAITEYLEDTFQGTPIYPSEPRAKALARQVQAWLRSDLKAIRQERSTEVLFYGTRGQPLSESAKGAADKLFGAARRLLKPECQNLFGQWSIADFDLALMLNRLALHGDPVPEPLASYAKRQWERPAVQMWVNRVRPPL